LHQLIVQTRRLGRIDPHSLVAETARTKQLGGRTAPEAKPERFAQSAHSASFLPADDPDVDLIGEGERFCVSHFVSDSFLMQSHARLLAKT